MPVADVTHGLEIPFGRRHTSGSGSNHRLGHECSHRIWAEALKFGLQLGRQPRHEIRFRFVVAFLVIGERSRHVAEGRRQQRRVGFATPGVSACRQGPERIAVVALAPGDEALALRLTAFDKILPRQFDAGLDRFRSAADEVGIGEPARFIADELLGQRFGRLRREEAGMGISELRRLPCDSLDHARVLMPEAGNGGAAGAVENPPAILGNEPDAVAADGLWRHFAQASMQHPAVANTHDAHPFSETYCDIAARRISVCWRRRFEPTPPSTNVTAASDCAIAIAPVRLGKNPGEAAASNSRR